MQRTILKSDLEAAIKHYDANIGWFEKKDPLIAILRQFVYSHFEGVASDIAINYEEFVAYLEHHAKKHLLDTKNLKSPKQHHYLLATWFNQHLDKLPIEIWLTIASYLNQKDSTRLMATCHHFGFFSDIIPRLPFATPDVSKKPSIRNLPADIVATHTDGRYLYGVYLNVTSKLYQSYIYLIVYDVLHSEINRNIPTNINGVIPDALHLLANGKLLFISTFGQFHLLDIKEARVVKDINNFIGLPQFYFKKNFRVLEKENSIAFFPYEVTAGNGIFATSPQDVFYSSSTEAPGAAYTINLDTNEKQYLDTLPKQDDIYTSNGHLIKPDQYNKEIFYMCTQEKEYVISLSSQLSGTYMDISSISVLPNDDILIGCEGIAQDLGALIGSKNRKWFIVRFPDFKPELQKQAEESTEKEFTASRFTL